MLDLILIEDNESGINLFEYRAPHTQYDDEHAQLFSGFFCAIQGISCELQIGPLVQLSTETHHCLLHREGRVLVILIIDFRERVRHWRNKARAIGKTFSQLFLTAEYNPNNTASFTPFGKVLCKIAGIQPAIS